jgi:hypothetical protein
MRNSLWLLGLSLIVLVPLASPAAADPDPKDPAAIRAKRHEQLAETEADLTEFCSTVRNWKVADAMTVAPDLAVLQDPGASEDSRSAAQRHLLEVDADAADLAEAQQKELRSDVKTIRESCGNIEDADAGLPVLSKDGAKLENVGKDRWDSLTDKLGAVVLSYKGKNAFGDSADQSYHNCYEKDCLSKTGRQSAKQQLANDGSVQFTTDFEDVIPSAIADLSKPHGSADGSK